MILLTNCPPWSLLVENVEAMPPQSSIVQGEYLAPALFKGLHCPAHCGLISNENNLLTVGRSLRQFSRCFYKSVKLSLMISDTLGSVRALQTYGPISGRGCLLDEPASQWEACIYIHTFATHGPISTCGLLERIILHIHVLCIIMNNS